MTHQELKVEPAKLISAAGGFDSIASEMAAEDVPMVGDEIDVGNDDLAASLATFASRWQAGLLALIGTQRDTAAALRTAVKGYTGTDVDLAYRAQVQTRGFDGLDGYQT